MAWPHECTVIGHPLGYVARREIYRRTLHEIAIDFMEHNFLMLNAHLDNKCEYIFYDLERSYLCHFVTVTKITPSFRENIFYQSLQSSL